MRTPAPALARPVDGPAPTLDSRFTAAVLTDLRHAVRTATADAGLHGERLDDFIVAVQELTTNAVRHGGGRGRLLLRRHDDTVTCEISDHGSGFPDGIPATGSPPPAGVPGGRGLWLATQLSDTLLITDRRDGVTVTITICLTAPGIPAGAAPAAGSGTVPAPQQSELAIKPGPPLHGNPGRSTPA
ncbi:anti-sigma regulatory factor [Actinoplanes sp. SE50]|uniref:ATP-binding protein n=1 Tax=unclassified Actinoplanes TaxID=2626549 RepID=UPI00023ED6EE|nr:MULTISPECIES: ATP-binding protein [unclassified Actinoplanes]AEV81204.1 putative anti-sigma regulatory factor, serine/threonine protein kinase [Actinoplanes sp. SE50/110]ATO79606.1 anti-sigma regulatory factor [Actinoplanes sp. SE50]SLL97009.1 anti-sigma regulatory factor [Actinoplanes sp. SE50/110]